jgi:hypothetical protein
MSTFFKTFTKLVNFKNHSNYLLLQEFSSEPSSQSVVPSHNPDLLIHCPFLHVASSISQAKNKFYSNLFFYYILIFIMY